MSTAPRSGPGVPRRLPAIRHVLKQLVFKYLYTNASYEVGSNDLDRGELATGPPYCSHAPDICIL